MQIPQTTDFPCTTENQTQESKNKKRQYTL